MCWTEQGIAADRCISQVMSYSQNYFYVYSWLTPYRLFADLLGFSGALGIQIIVTSLQNDIREVDMKWNSKMRNTTVENRMETFTSFQFVSCRMVAAVIILLASFSQGSLSQVIFETSNCQNSKVSLDELGHCIVWSLCISFYLIPIMHIAAIKFHFKLVWTKYWQL